MSGRRLGEAETQVERDLEAAVAAVPLWQGRAGHYEAVSGGISNANWRVFIEGDRRSYFVKIPGQGTELFIDRDAANDASVKAHAAGVSAEVIHYDSQSGVAVFEFIEGLRTSTNGDFLNESVRTNAVRALRAFNEGAALNLQKTLFDMIDEHVGQVAALGGHVPQDFDWLTAKYRQARAALEAAGLDLVPCMNDTLAGNFLLDGADRVTLVDFEYASNNDRCAELAVWFGEMFFPAEVERQVIEDYFGRVEERITARITLFKALADLKWSTWAMVQNRVSLLDFDFFKYGVWKHLRARKVMRDPNWEHWLRAV